MSAMADLAHARKLLEWDWLECRGWSGRRAATLHYPVLDDYGAMLDRLDDNAAIGVFMAACGRPMKSGLIPGVGARMDTWRCSQCCDALGYPRGKGSPKNDVRCRPLVRARLEAILL